MNITSVFSRCNNKHHYTLKISSRLGRTRYKEQFMFLYRWVLTCSTDTHRFQQFEEEIPDFARLEKQFNTTWLTLSARQPSNNSHSWINTHMYCSNYVYHISWQTFHFPDLVRSQGWSGRLGGLLSVWRQGDWVRRRFRQRSLHPAVQMPHYR